MLENQAPVTRSKIDLRVGEFLVAAKILTEKDLDEAMKTARATGLPIGRVFIMAAYVTETEFQAAVQAQSLVRDSILPLDVAIQALKHLSQFNTSFDEALAAAGWKSPEDTESNKLGELLLAAEIVPQAQMEAAMQTSMATGLPLGRLLVSLGSLSEEILASALNAQTLIRSGNVKREQAVQGLKSAYKRRKPYETSDQGIHLGPHRPSIRLGELLVAAQLVTDEDVRASLELSLVKEKSLGEMLVEQKVIALELLDSALILQEMASNETLSAAQAAACLKKLSNSDQSLAEILAYVAVPTADCKTQVRFHEVLRLAGLIQQADVESLGIALGAPATSADAFGTADLVLTHGLIDKRTCLGALRCYFLIATGWLNVQQGIISLNYFEHKQCSFDEALHALHWAVRTHIRTEAEEKQLESSTCR
jgi:hypothetical protein